jgi:hypothetical protein
MGLFDEQEEEGEEADDEEAHHRRNDRPHRDAAFDDADRAASRAGQMPRLRDGRGRCRRVVRLRRVRRDVRGRARRRHRWRVPGIRIGSLRRQPRRAVPTEIRPFTVFNATVGALHMFSSAVKAGSQAYAD